MLVTASFPLSRSPRAPAARTICPSSKWELRSSPVHRRTHRIMSSLLLLTPHRPLGWRKRNHGFRIEEGVEPPPRRVAGQLPVVATAARVLGEQDVAGLELKA